MFAERCNCSPENPLKIRLMKKKLNKLLNKTTKHGLADCVGKRAVISAGYVTRVGDTREHTKARVPLTQHEGVDGNATFKHSS